MVEIELKNNPNLVKETLNRIGICNKKDKVLYPSVYLHEQDGKYFLIHFKEWFILNREGSYNNITEQDMNRVLVIGSLLEKWGLASMLTGKQPTRDKSLYILKKEELANGFTIKHKIKY